MDNQLPTQNNTSSPLMPISSQTQPIAAQSTAVSQPIQPTVQQPAAPQPIASQPMQPTQPAPMQPTQPAPIQPAIVQPAAVTQPVPMQPAPQAQQPQPTVQSQPQQPQAAQPGLVPHQNQPQSAEQASQQGAQGQEPELKLKFPPLPTKSSHGPSFFGYRPPKWAHDFEYVRTQKGKGREDSAKTWLLYLVDRLLKMHSS